MGQFVYGYVIFITPATGAHDDISFMEPFHERERCCDGKFCYRGGSCIER